jgi:hypothetical protein
MNLSSVALPPVDEKTATIFVALEFLCSFASGVATTVRPANNGWSCMV